MRTSIFRFLLLSFAVMVTLILPNCTKDPINGDLDGQWQVMDLSPAAPDTIIQGRLYMCFSLHVCQLTSYGAGAHVAGTISYDRKRHNITINFPLVGSLTEAKWLRQYGIYSNPVTFDIELLTKSKLVLRDGDVVVTLRKF